MKHLRPLWLPLLLIIAASSALAQQVDEIRNRIPQIEKMVAEEMQKAAIPGAAVAIAKDGKLIYAKGFGYADLENKVPFTPRTVSRIGSISKTFTALAVMQLAEQGKIDLNAEVQSFVPTFPKKSTPITVRLLLCHQSGIRHYKGDEMMSAVHYNDVESALAIFKDDSLVNEPGVKYSYTTYGYNLLSRVVEAASGERFTDYLQNHIFNRIGLKQTFPDEPRRVISNRARYYTKPKDRDLENAPPVDQSNKWGGGGLLSTVEDLIQYGIAYDGNELAKQDIIKEMFTAQKTRDGKPTAYGLGWAIASDEGKRRIEHSGGSVGATSILTKYPDQGLIIAVLVNCDHYSAPQIKTRMARILFDNSAAKQ